MFVQEQATANERNVQSLLRLWQEGSIQPEVTETYPFSEAPSAIARLETRQTRGKIVVNLNYQ
jgi:NADPH:quinone reductase-like Zn-dependent oxidoreductase